MTNKAAVYINSNYTSLKEQIPRAKADVSTKLCVMFRRTGLQAV